HLQPFSEPPAVVHRAHLVGIHFGDSKAVAYFEGVAAHPKRDLRERVEAVQALALARRPGSVEPMLALALKANPAELKRAALRALAGYDDGSIAVRILAAWSSMPPELRTEVVGLLSGRGAWAHALLDDMIKGTINKQDLSENDIRRILARPDADLVKKV